jgi:multidrug resistance efflux pump
VPGRVLRILVEPGTAVDPNTVLLELDNPDLVLELYNAKMELESAERSAAKQKVLLQSDLLEKKANLASRQADYNKVKLQLDVDEKEYEGELISLQKITLSRDSVKQMENLLKISQQSLEMYETQILPATLTELEATVSKARSNHDLKYKHVQSLKVRAGTAGILAPITSKIEPGQSVSAGMVVAKITNPKKLKAQLKVPEAQARDVIIGLEAEVDTHHGTVLGKVSRVDPTSMEGNVTVDVSLGGALPQGARPDLSVVGTITIERLNDVLNVGRPVFASSEGPSELFKVVEDGRYAVRSRVQFGRTSVSTIEVLEGLEVGEEIILSDMSQWDSCDRIRLR